MDWNIVLQLVQSLGLPIVLCLFFVWQNKLNQDAYRRETQKRENLLSDRLNAVELFVKEEMLTVVKDCTSTMAQCNQVMTEVKVIMSRAEQKLNNQP